MSTRLKIDLAQGTLEVEGEEVFVHSVYNDFKERLMTKSLIKQPPQLQKQEDVGKDAAEKTGLARYSTLAECITAARAKDEAEHALVAAAYFQANGNLNEITGQQVNKALTHTGHGVANITVALQSNIDHSPQFVIQISKSGKAKQARKKYKVTDAGLAEVERMIAAVPETVA